jgi:hypothetical protein
MHLDPIAVIGDSMNLKNNWTHDHHIICECGSKQNKIIELNNYELEGYEKYYRLDISFLCLKCNRQFELKYHEQSDTGLQCCNWWEGYLDIGENMYLYKGYNFEFNRINILICSDDAYVISINDNHKNNLVTYDVYKYPQKEVAILRPYFAVNHITNKDMKFFFLRRGIKSTERRGGD